MDIFKNKKNNFRFIKINEEENKEKQQLYKKSKKYCKIPFNKKNRGNKSKKYFIISLITFIIIIIFCRIIIISLNINLNISKKNIESNFTISNLPNLPNIQNISYFNNTKKYKILSNEEALEIGMKFMDICKAGMLVINEKFTETDKPKISVIITSYNSEKTIQTTLRSIQNQNMTDIEVIIVNDLSTDNSVKIIEEIQREDPRIKIIHNSKRMGTLYSRSIGVLNSRGKFVTSIDSDDFFSNSDIFDIIYEETESEYYDIISFKVLQI
jgi:hypothetical protein